MSSWAKFGVEEALSRILEDSQDYDTSGEECLDGVDDLDETDLQFPGSMVQDDLNDERCDRDATCDDDSSKEEWAPEDLVPLARLRSTPIAAGPTPSTSTKRIRHKIQMTKVDVIGR